MPVVRLIARPQFIALPPELGTPREDQLQGPDAQKLIETAARTCYDSFGKGRDSDGHARHVMDVGHYSVLEHAQYTFFIGGVSRGMTHEHVRHRIGVAISQRSTRYCDESESEWIPHPLFTEFGGDIVFQWSDAVETCQQVYDNIVTELEAALITRGTDKLTARKQARGAARGILGNALATELVWSANVNALRHYIDLRASAAADAEIRAVAIAILKIMQIELPVYFKDYEIRASPDGIGEIAVKEK